MNDATGRETAMVDVTTPGGRPAGTATLGPGLARALLESSSDVVVVIDGEGHFRYVSPAAERMLGHRPEEWVGRDAFDLIHPDDAGLAAEALVSTAETAGVKVPITIRLHHADGSWRAVEIVANNMLGDPAVRGVVVNARDLTDRISLGEVARDAEARFQQVFDHAPIGMVMTDLEGTYLRVNQAFCNLLGYSRARLLKTSFTALTHPEDLAETRLRFERLVIGEVPSYSSQKRFRRADGTYRWVTVHASVVRGDDGVARYAVGQIEDAQDRHEMEEQLAHDATHDLLTGLANRVLLLDEVDRALARSRRAGGGVALLFVDLDRFKLVNDSLGHAAGDVLLVGVAERIRSAVRECDTPARLGGDEFVVLCPDLHDVEEAVVVAERLAASIHAPFSIEVPRDPDTKSAEGAAGPESHEAFVGASIGIAFTAAGDGDAATMLTRADTAAYRAKDRGRDRVEVFDDNLRAEVERRRERQAVLHHAIERGELVLEYRPVVELATRDVAGYEISLAASGMSGPRMGGVDLLDAAGEAGLAPDLARFALRRATARISRWEHERGPEDVPTLSLHLSARQLVAPGIVGDVRRALAGAGVDASNLCLGLPEDALVRDLDLARERLAELRHLGVHLAIVGFGGGRFALRDLASLAVDSVKLDPALVAGLALGGPGRTGADETEAPSPDAAVAEAVLGVALSLGLRTVAAGVATEEQVAALAGFGCQYASGPLFAGLPDA